MKREALDSAIGKNFGDVDMSFEMNTKKDAEKDIDDRVETGIPVNNLEKHLIPDKIPEETAKTVKAVKMFNGKNFGDAAMNALVEFYDL